MCGLITVAPAQTSDLPASKFSSFSSTPVMIIRGEKDTSIGVPSSQRLSLIKSATREFVLPGAGHPAYMDQPDMFNGLLNAFMKEVKC